MAFETCRLIRSSSRDSLQCSYEEHDDDDDDVEEWQESGITFVRDTRIEFIHRTVYDFLNLPDIRCIVQGLVSRSIESTFGGC